MPCRPHAALVDSSPWDCTPSLLFALQGEVSKLEAAAAVAAESPEASALGSSISQKQQQLEKLESRLNGIKDRLFADFRWGSG